MKGIQQVLPRPQGYLLDSDPTRLAYVAFGGGLTKTVVGDVYTWNLPCGLATGLVSDPRLPGEGLACYFLRLLNGIAIGPGLTGPAGPGSTQAGPAAWTVTVGDFTPPTDSSSFIFSVATAVSHLISGHLFFIQGLGWIQLSSVTGTAAVATVVQRIEDPLTVIPGGSLVVPTGPRGVPGDGIFQVATPVIVPNSGTYGGPVSVSMTCATAGAIIRYTTNGTEPTEFSTAFSTPFEVSTATTVRAKAFKTGWLISAEASRSYAFGGSGFTIYTTEEWLPQFLLDPTVATWNPTYPGQSSIAGSWFLGNSVPEVGNPSGETFRGIAWPVSEGFPRSGDGFSLLMNGNVSSWGAATGNGHYAGIITLGGVPCHAFRTNGVWTGPLTLDVQI